MMLVAQGQDVYKSTTMLQSTCSVLLTGLAACMLGVFTVTAEMQARRLLGGTVKQDGATVKPVEVSVATVEEL